MLGQVFPRELFDTFDNEYQEVRPPLSLDLWWEFAYKLGFVIHIRHTKVYLFYAKLPNTYLSRITEHGAKYSHLFPTPQHKIKLCQSTAYSINNPADQANLFRDLANLLWYLSSGRSHVGYLCNCPRNSFVEKLVWSRMRLVLTGSPGLCKIVLWSAEWRTTNQRKGNILRKL
jgi:hypothetical protein